jgi:hypothetical protein
MRQNWREEARQAVERLRDCPYGERELRLRSFAAQLKYENSDPSSLRRAIGAFEFLERLRNEQAISYARLDGVSLSVAELMARLYEFDPTTLPDVAKDWQEGRVTVVTMRKLLEDTLPSGYAGKVGKARQRSFKEAASAEIQKFVGDMGFGEIVSIESRAKQGRSSTAKVDYLFVMHPKRTVAALTVGPYRNTSMYRDRAEEWILRAFGTALLYDVVLLVISDAKSAEIYRQKVKELSREIVVRNVSPTFVPRVEAVNIFIDPFGAEYAAIGDLAT